MRAFLRIGLGLLLIAQLVATLRVIARLVGTASGMRIIGGGADDLSDAASVTVLIPVLNEEHRLAACLDRLSAQTSAVTEILVIDGGSTDRTRSVVDVARRNDARIRWVDASPVPGDWNGKAWGLQRGFELRDPGSGWVLTIDADVRPGDDLVPSLLAHAGREHLGAFSVATTQRVSGPAEAIVHPALLATLVYRYGIPGFAERNPEAVQANGQCFLIRTDILERIDGFRAGRHSLSEDITIAREIARCGIPVGFFEPQPGLIEVGMYASARDAWTNWSRSLPMRDESSGWGWWLRMADMTLTVGLPLPLVAAGVLPTSRQGHVAPLTHLLYRLNAALVVTRIGVAVGMRRAYHDPPWTYWLSVLADPLVVAKVWSSAVRRQHMWRGRPIRRGYNDREMPRTLRQER